MKKFIKILDDNDIKDAEVIQDNHFLGGYKVIYENIITSINLVKIIPNDDN